MKTYVVLDTVDTVLDRLLLAGLLFIAAPVVPLWSVPLTPSHSGGSTFLLSLTMTS